MINRLVFVLLGAIAFASLSSPPAAALNARTWVSGTGVDQAGCGPIASPCRSLQYAHDNTAAGGEIDVKDSAGYGSVAITKAIAIVGDGSLAGVLAPANGNAITISAGSSDKIVLRSLTIEGAGSASYGILLNSAGSLDISDCTVQNFTGDGILLRPTVGTPSLFVTNTVSVHNGNHGLTYAPSSGSAATSLVVDRLIANDNGGGVLIDNSASTGKVIVSVRNSAASKNVEMGFYFSGGQIDLDFCHADENGQDGYGLGGGATVTIGRSVGASNVHFGLSNYGGTALSFKDNRFNGNGQYGTNGTIGTATLF